MQINRSSCVDVEYRTVHCLGQHELQMISSRLNNLHLMISTKLDGSKFFSQSQPNLVLYQQNKKWSASTREVVVLLDV